MRINSDEQTALSKRAAMRRIDLYVVTTYTDRDAKTVADRYFWSDGTRRYDYNREGTVREFLPVVRSRSGPQAETMLDIQDFGGSQAQTFEIILSNRPTAVGGPHLLEQVRARLFRATLEVIEVMLHEGQDEADLSNLPGDRHTVAFRGELRSIPKADQDVFTLHFETVEPTVPWLYAAGQYVDPDDLGRRLPIVYGSMPFVQAIGQEVGGETTTSVSYLSVTPPENVHVADSSRFQAPGSAFIDGELVNFSATLASPPRLTISARAQGGTSLANHDIGASVVEARACVYIVAGHAITSLDRLFARRTDGRLYEIPTNKYTVSLSDTTTFPGQTVATVTISKDQFIDIVKATHSDSEEDVNVTQQPSVNQQTTIKTLGEFEVGWMAGGGGGGVDIVQGGWNYRTIPTGGSIGETFTPSVEDYTGAQSAPVDMALHLEGWPGSGPVDQSGTTPAENHGPPFGEYDIYVWFGTGAGFDPGPGSLARSGGELNAFGPYGFVYTEEHNPDALIIGPVVTISSGDVGPFSVSVDLTALRERGISPDTVKLAVAKQNPENTGAFPNIDGFAIARSANIVLATQQTTDIEVAGDDASKVKATSKRTTSPGSGSASRLKVFATMRGYDLDEFPEIADHFIEQVCGVTDGGDHSPTRPFTDASQAGLVHACDMRTLGIGFSQIMSRLAWESRANIVRTEGQITPVSSILDLSALVLPEDAFLPIEDDRPSNSVGFDNTFTIMLLMLVPRLHGLDLGTFSSWVSVVLGPDVFASSPYIAFGDGVSGKLIARVGDPFGSPAKVYEYAEPAGLTLDGGAGATGHLPTLTLTWNGTSLKLWLDGTELTPVNVLDDDAVTLTPDGAGTIQCRGGSPEAGRDSYFFGLAAWNVAMGATEIAAAGNLMRAGIALTANSGSYVSAANLKQHFRPGFAADDLLSNALVGDVPTDNGYLDTDGAAVSDIIDTGGWDNAKLRLVWALLSGLETEDLTVSAVLDWGNAADMSDAAPINTSFLTGGVPSDFDFTLVDGVITAGTGFVQLFYDTTAIGAKRYLRWTVTVTGLVTPEFISFFSLENLYDDTSHAGDATVRNDVPFDAGGVSPRSTPPWELVVNPEVIPTIPGVTFYRYLCAGDIDSRFSYGFPNTNATSEDLLGALFDQFVTVSETLRDPETLKNRFRALFAMNEALGGPTDGAAFEQTIQAVRENSAIVYPGPALLDQSEKRWGKREEAPMLFATIQSLATAIDTLSFLAHVALRDIRLWEFIGVPWEIAYQLDIGDTVAVPGVPWAPNEAWIARLLGIARNPDTGMAHITALGVQRRGAFRGNGFVSVTGSAAAAHARGLAGAGDISVLILGAGVGIAKVTMAGAGPLGGLVSGAGTALRQVIAVGLGDVPNVSGNGDVAFVF